MVLLRHSLLFLVTAQVIALLQSQLPQPTAAEEQGPHSADVNTAVMQDSNSISAADALYKQLVELGLLRR